MKLAIFFLLAMEAPAVLMLIAGMAFDNDSLIVGSYAWGMPVTFALLSLVGFYWAGSNKP